MRYDYRLHIIMPLANLATANSLAMQVDTDTGADKTFGVVRLSATGAEPASHTGCSTQARQAERDMILQMASVYTWAKVFEAPTTFDGAIANLGLQRIVSVVK